MTAPKKRNEEFSDDNSSTAASSTEPMKKGPLDEKVKTLKELGFTHDKTAARKEYHTEFFGVFDGILKEVLKDEIDRPLALCLLNVTFMVVPAAILLFFLPDYCFPYAGIAYLIVAFVGFMERFILALHYSSHVKIFKPKYDILNKYAGYMLAPFFGMAPGMYYLHHVIMHHSENNHDLDISETESYDRSKFTSFLQYWGKFMMVAYLLPRYAAKTSRWSWFVPVLLGVVVYFGTIISGFFHSNGVFYVFSVSHLVAIFAMAFGNYSQHIFVSPTNPDVNYELTYNCIETIGNQLTFNDGYHILHHQYARAHWAELPDLFVKELPVLKKNNAFTFHNCHFFEVGLYVVTGNLEKLARNHYVHLNGFGLPEEDEKEVPTVGEVVAEMKRRLQPIAPYKRDKMKAA